MNNLKSVLRSTTVMFLFVWLVGIWMGGCEKLTQEQRNAVYALGQLGLGYAMPALIQVLQDQNWDVRNSAAMALGNIGKDAVPALIQTLQDQNWDVRGNAANTLGEIEEGAIDAVPALITGVAE